MFSILLLNEITLKVVLKIINKIINFLVVRLVTLLIRRKFELLKKQTTLVDSKVTIQSLFNHIYNVYHLELKESGLMGVMRLRRQILDEINSLNVLMFKPKNSKGMLDSLDLKDSFKHLKCYRDILYKVKLTVELLTFVKTILKVLTNAAFLPVFATIIYLLAKKL
jgi:hypothetical protein